MIKIANAAIAIVSGVGGALLIYYVLNKLVELMPQKWQDRLLPYVFVGPAVLVISAFLIYPALRTLMFSFANEQSTAWVGLSNYTNQLTDSTFVGGALLNTLLWILIVPALTVVFGLGVAVLADRLRPQVEKVAKSIIFLPMAISLVGAGTIWNLIYKYNAPGDPQVGAWNAIVTSLFKIDPINWKQLSDFHLNSLLLMVIMIWAQVGFAMVLLSAAIKSVPEDTLEAARIDGANERQAFFRVVVPQIWPTVITVFITILINVMKVFDIVYVMGNGNFNTEVIAVRFFNEMFTNGNNGYAAAIVVMLMVAIVPVMIYQVRQFRAQEAR